MVEHVVASDPTVKGGTSVNSIASEASTGVWSPDGKSIAFVSAVYPEFSDKPYAESNASNSSSVEPSVTSAPTERSVPTPAGSSTVSRTSLDP